MNIRETRTESKGGAHSEHGFAGGNPPPPAANFSQGKSRQTHLTPSALIKVRGVFAGTTGGGGFTNFPNITLAQITDWYENYDITKLAWNTMVFASWGAASESLTPDFLSIISPDGSGDFFHSSVYAYDIVPPPPDEGLTAPYYMFRTQMGLDPSASVGAIGVEITGYMIIAVDQASVEEGNATALYGCSYPLDPHSGPVVINLPAPPGVYPNPTMPFQIAGLMYFFGLIGPANNAIVPNVAPDLDTFAAGLSGYAYQNPADGGVVIPGGISNFGPDWNAGVACQVPSGPPFA